MPDEGSPLTWLSISDYKRTLSRKQKQFVIFVSVLCLAEALAEFALFALFASVPLRNAFLNLVTFVVYLAVVPLYFEGAASAMLTYVFPMFLVAPVTYLVDSGSLPPWANAGFVVVPAALYLSGRRRLWNMEAFFLKQKPGGRLLLLGLSAGVVLVIHLTMAVLMTGKYGFHALEPGFVVYWGFFVVCLSAPAEEIFYRGFVFAQMMNRGASFWVSAMFSSVCLLVRYLVNPYFHTSAVASLGLIFYIVTAGVLFCYLLWSTKSLYPGMAANALIGVFYHFLREV